MVIARSGGRGSARALSVFFGVLLCAARAAAGADWYVAPGGGGRGTAAAPFARIQDGLAAAAAGDVVYVAPGTYGETLRTVRDGGAGSPITLRATDPRRRPIVRWRGRVLTIRHAHVVIDGLVLEGLYGPDDVVRIETAATGTHLRNCDVGYTSHDAIDIQAPSDVVIERCAVHHALNARGGRRDAHGIAAGAVRRLTIRDTDVHTFSGDGIQVDPGRDAPGWDQVLIERCRLWLAPLGEAANGFAAGVVPGENALDTKAAASFRRARITVRDSEASGFRAGLIANMAAFNVKEHVDAVLDRVTVFDSEIAFRLRGAADGTGARVQVSNAVIYETYTAFRYEDGIDELRIWNVTVGSGVRQPFLPAGGRARSLDVRNLLVLAARLPAEAASGLAVDATAFVDAVAHDYRLRPDSAPVDAGVAIPEVTGDRDGTPRPQGAAYDLGAYERVLAPGGRVPAELSDAGRRW